MTYNRLRLLALCTSVVMMMAGIAVSQIPLFAVVWVPSVVTLVIVVMRASLEISVAPTNAEVS